MNSPFRLIFIRYILEKINNQSKQIFQTIYEGKYNQMFKSLIIYV